MVSIDLFAPNSLNYHISDLKKNLTNIRYPANVEDDKKVVVFSRSRFGVIYT